MQILEDNRYIATNVESLGQRIDDKDWQGVRWHLADRVIIRVGNAVTPTVSSSDSAEDVGISADELVTQWQRALPNNVGSFHAFGVPIVNVQGDIAKAEVNGEAWNSPMFGDPQAAVRGRYEFIFVRAGPRTWKISEMSFRPLP